MTAAERTPEQRRRSRITHFIIVGLKLTLLGAVFLFALDNAKAAAVTIGILSEIGAVACFVKAYRLAYRRPPQPAAPYAALQESMRQIRESDARSSDSLPRQSPLTPR